MILNDYIIFHQGSSSETIVVLMFVFSLGFIFSLI